MKWLAYAAVVLVVCMVAIVGPVLYMTIHAHGYIYASVDTAPQSQVAVVPGASIIGTSTLSGVLQERADTAIALYQTGKVANILITGDNSNMYHNEVGPVGAYIAASGVPKSNIFLDNAGLDTYSSMYRAREVFGTTSLIIVSQAFHLPRAIYIARSLGLEAFGVDAGHGQTFLYNDIREIPASFKALYDLAVHRVPK